MAVATTHARWIGRIALIATLALAPLLVTFGYGRDQGIYDAVARITLDGGMPYRDAFDFKPPGIFVVYALSRALFGGAWWGIRLCELASLTISIASMVWLSKRWWGEKNIGYIAGFFLTLITIQLDFWHTGQPESFGGMLVLLALCLASTSRPSAKQWLAVGVLCGAAGLLKPPLAGCGAVIAWFGAAEQRKHATGWVSALAPVGWVLSGGVAVTATCLAWFAARGALDPLITTLFKFAPHYTKLSWHGHSFWTLFAAASRMWLTEYSSLLSWGLGLLVLSGLWHRPKSKPLLLLAVVAIQLVGIALQAKFFPYHYAGLWPMTAMLAALGWWRALTWCNERSIAFSALLGLAFVFAFQFQSATKHLPQTWWQRAKRRYRLIAGGLRDTATIDELASVADVDSRQNRQLARDINRLIGQEKYIYIFGFEPVVYALSNNRSSSRFIYNVPQRAPWSARFAQDELMLELKTKEPEVIVVAHGDAMPHVTGNITSSYDIMRTSFPALRRLLENKYRHAKRSGDFEIFVRNEQPRQTPP